MVQGVMVSIQNAEYYRSNHAEVGILRGGNGGLASKTADGFPAISLWLELLENDAVGSVPSRLLLRLLSSFVAMDLSASEAGEAGSGRSATGCGVSGRVRIMLEVVRGGRGGGIGRDGGG
jgi:hypothetical protein